MTSIEYNEMIRKFDKEISYAVSFGDNSIEVIKSLKESFIELYNNG